MSPKKKASRSIVSLNASHWDTRRLKLLLKKIEKKRILVIGDVGVDRYTIGLVERISPEAPVPIVLVEQEKLKLGLAANVADNVQALGGTSLLTGIVGEDRTAEDFRGLLKESGIQAQHLVVDRSRRTVLKERIVSDRQQLLRVDYESLHSLDRRMEAALLEKILELIPKCDAVILEDYAKGMLSRELASAIFAAAREAGKMVTVDPNAKTGVDMYKGATVLTPNTKEAEKLTGIQIVDDASLMRVGFQILKATAAQYVVITRGKEGMAIFTEGAKRVKKIPTFAREVFDVSGAGDTVISVMTLALSAGASIEEAAILGNLAAGVEVGKSGTATVSPDEILLAMAFFGVMKKAR